VSAVASAYAGWLATATFTVSYFFRRPAATRAMQMFGAALWISYGCLIASAPVIVANALVLAAASGAALRSFVSVAAAAEDLPPALQRD
jgi:hypothetical protein